MKQQFSRPGTTESKGQQPLINGRKNEVRPMSAPRYCLKGTWYKDGEPTWSLVDPLSCKDKAKSLGDKGG